MFKEMKKRIKNEKGLTLIELLAVIVILAIVAAIAIPAIGNIIDNSRGKALKSDVVNVMSAANIYFTDTSPADKATIVLDDLQKEGYLDSKGKLTSATVTYNTGGANTITAAGKNGSVTIEVTAATLDNINAHEGKPEGGKVTITSSTTAPVTP